MTNESKIYQMPNMGCRFGTAFQMLCSSLAEALTAAGLDVTVPEYILLRALYSRDGMQQCEIADLIGKDKAAISRCVTAMQKKGLVRTEPMSRKCVKVYVSDKGREIEPMIMAVAKARHKALTDLLSDEELSVLSKVLDKIINK
ncbi:MAG: MarR family transcriptional regulator [Paramuribaculum sp.]|nr:MarR family transcriptional regulator [Paramuribaculum sp.]